MSAGWWVAVLLATLLFLGLVALFIGIFGTCGWAERQSERMYADLHGEEHPNFRQGEKADARH